MERSLQRTIINHTFWIALLLHLSLLLSFSLSFMFPVKKMEKGPELYTPSYIYHGNITQPTQPSTASHKAQPKSPPPQAKSGTERQVKSEAPNKNMAFESSQVAPVDISKTSDPVHLIGDKNVNKPLLTLLGKALSAHLVYPKIAVDFNLRGIVLVGFLLHPDGTLTNVEVVRKSNAGVLDAAALSAVIATSPVSKVNTFIKEPKYLVVGVIFG